MYLINSVIKIVFYLKIYKNNIIFYFFKIILKHNIKQLYCFKKNILE